MDDTMIPFLPMWRDVMRSLSCIYWGSTSRTGYPRSCMGNQTHSKMGRGHWTAAYCSTFGVKEGSDATQNDVWYDPRDIFSDVDL